MAGRHRPKIGMGKRLAVYVRDNWTCQYCGVQITPKTEDQRSGRYAPWIDGPNGSFDAIWLELDHIVPRKLGGDDSVDNLRAACTPCNKRKLATTRCTDWAERIRLAQELLAAGPPSEETAKSAAALLIGCLQRELPRMRGGL